MNKFYESLPPDLKLLADHLKEPYDKNYKYVKDLIVFLEYEKDLKGKKLVSFDPHTCNLDQSAYTMLQIYSPLTEQVDLETALKEVE